MVLKVANNKKLKIYNGSPAVDDSNSSTVSDNFKQKSTGIMITECPNVSAYKILNDVRTYKLNNTGTATPLKNMRIQLDPHKVGNTETYTYGCTGTYDTLMSYSAYGNGGTVLSGYEADGKERLRPGLVGMWTITDYIDDGMAEALSGTNGRYTVGVGELQLSSNYRIRWEDIAVHCVDPTKPNYNPAVSLILNSKSYGSYHPNTEHFPGGWWITKEEAAGIKNVRKWFCNVGQLQDTQGIVSSAKSTYNFTSFDEFSGFTGVSSLEVSAFGNNANLASLRLPNTIDSIPQCMLKGCTSVTTIGELPNSVSSIQASAFDGCSNMTMTNLGSGITEIEECAFGGCGNVTFSTLPSNLRYISNSSFSGCSNISVSEIPDTVGFIGENAFSGCSNITSVHIARYNENINVLSGAFDESMSYPIYVGTSDSSWLSERQKRRYAICGTTSAYSNRLSSWFTKDAAAHVPAEYEIQRYVTSDGLSSIDTGLDYGSGTAFETDVSFDNCSEFYVHGSASTGLSADSVSGVMVKLAGDVERIVTGRFDDGVSRNYKLYMPTSIAMVDGEEKARKQVGTTPVHERITLFGNGSGKFIGTSWMGRVSESASLDGNYSALRNLVPVRRKSDGRMGLFDTVTNTFYQGGVNFTSDEVSLTSMIVSGAESVGITDESGNVIELI